MRHLCVLCVIPWLLGSGDHRKVACLTRKTVSAQIRDLEGIIAQFIHERYVIVVNGWVGLRD